MGNEQSSEKEKRKRDADIQANLQKTLENQRKMYEQRCQIMLKTQAESLRKQQLESTRFHLTPCTEITTAGTSRDGQNNLYPTLQASTTREQPSPVTSISSSVHQRYNVTSQRVNLSTEVPPVNAAKRVIPSAPPISSVQPMKVNSVQNTSGLGSEYNCPKCGNKFGSYIYQCGSGHSSCMDCKINSGICSVLNCRKTITDLRNRTLEELIAQLMVANNQTSVKDKMPRVNQTINQQRADPLKRLKCPNQPDGCKLHFTSNEMGNHLKECLFKEMACPLRDLFGSCSWRGKFNQLDSHFADCHPEQRQAQVDTELTIVNPTDDKRIFYLVLLSNFNFFIHLKLDSNAKMLYLAAQLVGSAVSASKWQYEFHVYNKAQPRRKFQYSDVCTSNAKSIESIFLNKQCAAIPISYIDTFFNHNCLNYKFFLKKQNYPKRNN